MIDVYVLTSPNVQKVLIALEELNLPYRMHVVDVWKGDHFRPSFGKLNPNRKIPVIVDHDGPCGKALTLSESGAILIYLAEKAGNLLPTDVAARFAVLQWLMIQIASVGPNFGNYTYFSEKAPAGNDHALSRFRTESYRLYDLLEYRLSTSRYLGGQDYSIADIAMFPWIRLHQRQGVDLVRIPHVQKWFNEVADRPAVKAMMATVRDIKTSRDVATQDDWDRLHGRGRFAREAPYEPKPI